MPSVGHSRRALRRTVGMMTLGRPVADDEPKIDEKWMGEYRDWGMGELNYYLLKVARLDEWERRHPRPTEEENTDAS